jgi:hypothetical protein
VEGYQSQLSKLISEYMVDTSDLSLKSKIEEQQKMLREVREAFKEASKAHEQLVVDQKKLAQEGKMTESTFSNFKILYKQIFAYKYLAMKESMLAYMNEKRALEAQQVLFRKNKQDQLRLETWKKYDSELEQYTDGVTMTPPKEPAFPRPPENLIKIDDPAAQLKKLETMVPKEPASEQFRKEWLKVRKDLAQMNRILVEQSAR